MHRVRPDVELEQKTSRWGPNLDMPRKVAKGRWLNGPVARVGWYRADECAVRVDGDRKVGLVVDV